MILRFFFIILLLGSWVPLGKAAAHSAYVDLKGPWEFYWQSLLRPSDPLPPSSGSLMMDRYWNDFVQDSGLKTPFAGFASYRLVLPDLEPRPDGYSLTFKHAGSAYRAFAYPLEHPERALDVSAGHVGSNPRETHVSRNWQTLSFHPSERGSWVILVQVANFHIPFGGVRYTPVFSEGTAYLKDHQIQQLGTFLCTGVMVSIAFYSFMMFWRRREDKPSLFLCGVATLASLRTIALSPFLCDLFPDSAWLYSFQWRNEYLIASPAVALFMFLLSHNLGIPLPRFVVLASIWINIAVISLISGSSLMFYLQNRFWIFLSLALHMSVCLTLMYKAVRENKDGAQLVFWSSMIPGLAVIHDLFVGFGYISHPWLVQYGFAAFLIAQSQLVATRSARAYAQAKILAENLKEKNAEIIAFNSNLENLVESKTREIKSILDHVPQGILMIGRGALVASEYSANLPEIIGQSEIAQRSVMDLIFLRTDLSPDKNDQLLQSITASVGESSLSFELNADKFPTQFVLTTSRGAVALKATWSPITNPQDEVDFLLLTVLDVTLERQLEQQSREQRRELEIVHQLLNVEPKKVAQFFHTSYPLLEENRRLLSLPFDLHDTALIRSMFVNIHTVKGSARTLGFQELADKLHTLEETYQQILREGAIADPEQLRREQGEAIAFMDEYRQINGQKLNRSETGQSVSVDRSFLEKFYGFLRRLMVADTRSPVSVSRQARDYLGLIEGKIYEPLVDVFEAYKERAVKIAKDIGRETPLFDFQVLALHVPNEYVTILDNCMIHILRNALDHGIETVAERLASGKPQAGTIRVRSRYEDETLSLWISDDGRGLAVDRLRQRALELRLIDEKASLAAIADTIFAPGLSTAHAVTIHSGRGVGMGAVRGFLQRIQGSIELEFDSGKMENNRLAFAILIRLPLKLSLEDHKKNLKRLPDAG